MDSVVCFKLQLWAIHGKVRLKKISYLQSLCIGDGKFLTKSFVTSSSQYNQANVEHTRQFGNPNFIVTAFIKQLEDLEQHLMLNPITFVIYSVFQQKLVYNFRTNNYEANLASSILSGITRHILPPVVFMKNEAFCILHGIDYVTLYIIPYQLQWLAEQLRKSLWKLRGSLKNHILEDLNLKINSKKQGLESQIGNKTFQFIP